MTKWWREDPRLPKYINRLKGGQKNTALALLPISDEWLTAIATSYVLEYNIFHTVQDKCDELPIASKTWKKWKDHFGDAQAAIKCATRASVGFLGSANSAAAFHRTVTATPATDSADKATIPSVAVDDLGRYLDNMAAAATNER